MNKSFTLSILFIFSCFLIIPQLSADNCIASSSGFWDDPLTWSCNHVPVPGDVVTIKNGATVTIRYSYDISSGVLITMFIESGGFLSFNPPFSCSGDACKIDLKLPDGSSIDVKGTNGIFVGPDGDPSKMKLSIGNNLVLHNSSGSNAFPFGPGILPDGFVPLPVELSAFYGKAMDRSNMLKWQTESEENSLAFLVERSLDGRNDFVEIGRINAAGNSTTPINYELEDLNPVSLAYYRLRIVDFDGTYEFSDVIAVERTKTQIDLVEIYPNPAEEEVTVLVHAKTSGKAIMTLFDFLGRKIKEEKVELKAGINHYSIEFGEHETNFYYLSVYDGTERIAKKILRASKD